MDSTPITIVPMCPEHVKDVVRVHLESFQGFFLTCLGPRFLHLLYAEIIKEPCHIAFVAQNGSGVVGFVAGVAHRSEFFKRLVWTRQFAFAIAALGAVIRDLRIVPRLFRALNYSRSSKLAAAPAELMSIGVMPELQSKGVGKRLVIAFLDGMKLKKVDKVALTTDKDDNERVNLFYLKLGFVLYRSYVTPESRWLNEYVIDLSDWLPIAGKTETKDIQS